MRKSMYVLAGVLAAGALTGAVLFGSAAAFTTAADISALEDFVIPAADGVADVQEVEAEVYPFAYPQITVEVNKPVRVNFKMDAASLNACNNEIIIPEWNIKQRLTEGDNFVEFTPAKTGTFRYSCWMNMIQSNIVVIEEGSGEAGASEIDPSAGAQTFECPMFGGNFGSYSSGGYGGCCGARF